MLHHQYAYALLLVCASTLAQTSEAPRLKPSNEMPLNQDRPAPDSQAQNSGPIGFVKTVAGEASVTTEGKSVKAILGTPVLRGSVLRTGADGSLGVTFKDSTMMSFGPRTELTVDDYLYAPAQGQLQLGARLSRGTLNYVSGVIAKLKPDSVSVRTPSGLIGVRGTQFVAKVEPQGAGQ